jgi:Fe-S cluster assembly protein SufB
VPTSTKQLDELIGREYRHGFVTTLETDTVPRGLNEEVIRMISARKNEGAARFERGSHPHDFRAQE